MGGGGLCTKEQILVDIHSTVKTSIRNEFLLNDSYVLGTVLRILHTLFKFNIHTNFYLQ